MESYRAPPSATWGETYHTVAGDAQDVTDAEVKAPLLRIAANAGAITRGNLMTGSAPCFRASAEQAQDAVRGVAEGAIGEVERRRHRAWTMSIFLHILSILAEIGGATSGSDDKFPGAQAAFQFRGGFVLLRSW